MKTRRRISKALAILLAFALLYAIYIEPYWVEVTHSTLTGDVRAPLKILQLSDLHIREFGRREKRVLEIIENEKPDLIAVTGDYVTRAPRVEETVRLFSQMKARYGIWVVNGNWEHSFPSDVDDRLARLPNVHVLNNSSEQAAPGIHVIGIDDRMNGKPQPSLAFGGAPAGGLRIVLFHSPAEFDHLDVRFDLALSGHTHDGQVRLPFLPPLWLPPECGRFLHGWYDSRYVSGAKMYVSRGIGTSMLDIRFLARPEASVITVVPL